MLTYPSDVLVRDDRPAFRVYSATVSRIEQRTPHFRRVTFTSPEFATFGTDGLDQRIKLLFPLEGIGISDIGDTPDWYTRWRELPNEARNPIRTYTVRAVRQHEAEVDVDFVVHNDDHGASGPAAQWLLAADEGSSIAIVGPDARSIHSAIGIDWHPGTATELLLVGDETATPAICSILEALPAGVRATAFIEVPSVADAVEIESAANVTITWIGRDASGAMLEESVRGWVAENRDLLTLAPAVQELEDVNVDLELIWDSPEDAAGRFYAWLAGESAVIKRLRRLLVTETGIDRSRVAFMGYWRLGKSEGQ